MQREIPIDQQKLLKKTEIEVRRHQEEYDHLKHKDDYLEEYWEARRSLKHARRRHLYMTGFEEMYPDRYYEKRNRRVRKWERELGQIIGETFAVKSAVDFGCALGSYLEGIRDAGAEKVLGFEKAESAIKFAPDAIRPFLKQADLGESIDCGKWDCAMSIEVAEHIPEEYADIFVENLIFAAERLIIFTASQRSSHRHINPQLPEYWIGKFVTRGCSYSNELTQKLRKAWKDGGCNRFYLIFNLMVFLAQDEKLIRKEPVLINNNTDICL